MVYTLNKECYVLNVRYFLTLIACQLLLYPPDIVNALLINYQTLALVSW